MSARRRYPPPACRVLVVREGRLVGWFELARFEVTAAGRQALAADVAGDVPDESEDAPAPPPEAA